MNRFIVPVLAICLLLSHGVRTPAESAGDRAGAGRDREAGGQGHGRRGAPGRPVVGLDISTTKLTDEGFEHLKALPELESLSLRALPEIAPPRISYTGVSDAGLRHLKAFPHLKQLLLDIPYISDAGLVHLRGMTTLNGLSIYSHRVTDAGLEHIKSLTQLELLGLGCPESPTPG